MDWRPPATPLPIEHQAVLRRDARDAWMAGVEAVDPANAVARALAARADLRDAWPATLVVATGKAAAGMMRGAFTALGAAGSPLQALVLLPAGADAGKLAPGTVVLRGGHPVPTIEGMAATQGILAAADSLRTGQRLLFLLSGGASALLEAPVAGLDAEVAILVHRALVASGLPIASINLVRGCLSAIKAGGLLQRAAGGLLDRAAGGLLDRASPARVTTLAISDVEGDDPAVIGSAPTMRPLRSRASACRQAIAVLAAAGVVLPAPAARVLQDGAAGQAPRERCADAEPATGVATSEPAASREEDYSVVASVRDAATAARALLVARGYQVDEQGAYLHGATTEAAAAVAVAIGARPRRGRRGVVLGGETTVAVTIASPGRGGRNLDLAARLALLFRGDDGIAVAVAGTDGSDGSSRAAGAVIDGGSAGRAEAGGRGLEAALAAFDTEAGLEAAGDLLVTGPTGTNVGDLVVALTRGA